MRLRDAMILVSRECGLEHVRSEKSATLRAQAEIILKAEHDEIVSSRTLQLIINSCFEAVGPDNGLDASVAIAFRYGMRVQRKLDNPEKTTSILDSPCALAGTDNHEAPDSKKTGTPEN